METSTIKQVYVGQRIRYNSTNSAFWNGTVVTVRESEFAVQLGDRRRKLLWLPVAAISACTEANYEQPGLAFDETEYNQLTAKLYLAAYAARQNM